MGAAVAQHAGAEHRGLILARSQEPMPKPHFNWSAAVRWDGFGSARPLPSFDVDVPADGSGRRPVVGSRGWVAAELADAAMNGGQHYLPYRLASGWCGHLNRTIRNTTLSSPFDGRTRKACRPFNSAIGRLVGHGRFREGAHDRSITEMERKAAIDAARPSRPVSTRSRRRGTGGQHCGQ